MAKKSAAKKSAKKAVAIPYKDKAKVTMVGFSFGATIPTQSFGNVTTRIDVLSEDFNAARDFATEKIEGIYAKYAEVKPAFMGRITETVKVVAATESVAPEQAATPRQPDALNKAAIEAQKEQVPVRSEDAQKAFEKAEKAVGLAATEEATHAIQEQIQKSVKIDAADKPKLYELVLKRRKVIAGSL